MLFLCKKGQKGKKRGKEKKEFTMKRNLSAVLVLSVVIAVVSGCEQNITAPNEINQNRTAQTGVMSEKETEVDAEKPLNVEKDRREFTVKKPVYPISEKTETYVDRFGLQTIKKEYIVPFHADIRDIAPETITAHQIQYAIESIVSPQNFAEKKVKKEIVAKTKAEARKFQSEYVYDDTDGTGTLQLDPDSIQVDVNHSEKIPEKESVVRTYDMNIKDNQQIPQTITANNMTMYLVDVSWKDMGDPGTGINGTDEKGAYGTYNTVASSWRASATYSGTKYHTKEDYKGTATYVGKILVKDSPTSTYTVIYKPNSMVANPSGLYYNNYINAMYQTENQKLSAMQSINPMALYQANGYSQNWMMKILFAFVMASFLFVISLMYVALKIWNKANQAVEGINTIIDAPDVMIEETSEDVTEETAERSEHET